MRMIFGVVISLRIGVWISVERGGRGHVMLRREEGSGVG
jgi:hypothetical protein